MQAIKECLAWFGVAAFALAMALSGPPDYAYSQDIPAYHAQSPSLGTSLVAVASGGHRLVSFEVNADATLSGAAWYVLIYDATADPGNGSVTPAKCFSMPSGTTQMGGTYAPAGVRFFSGIVLVVSTTGCFTETQSSHAFLAADWQ